MTDVVSPARPIGLIGLGLMGSAFATRLLRGGSAVVGFDIDASRRATLDAQGGVSVVSSAEVVRQCDRVILSLPSHREVGQTIASVDGALRAGFILIDTTTGDPGHTASLAHELAPRGVAYLDATISGNSRQVQDGAAVVMVGGDREAFARCAEVLAQLGRETFYTGASGTGAKMKLVTNLVLGLNRAALAEGLALGEAIGLEPELTLRVMRGSPAYSRIMDVKGEKMIRSEFSPDARLSQHLKDVRLIMELGTQAGLPMTLSAAHQSVLEQAEADGLGALDNSALIQVLRGISAQQKRPGGPASKASSLESTREAHVSAGDNS
jgi:3-hydroxyisobutyrate dehydrogenase-like beta-hydroxyacid dehydrogenase